MRSKGEDRQAGGRAQALFYISSEGLFEEVWVLMMKDSELCWATGSL